MVKGAKTVRGNDPKIAVTSGTSRIHASSHTKTGNYQGTCSKLTIRARVLDVFANGAVHSVSAVRSPFGNAIFPQPRAVDFLSTGITAYAIGSGKDLIAVRETEVETALERDRGVATATPMDRYSRGNPSRISRICKPYVFDEKPSSGERI